VTSFGLQIAMFFTRTHNHLLRSGLSQMCDPAPIDTALRRQFDRLEDVIADMIGEVGLAA
jgi:hypothetical protein